MRKQLYIALRNRLRLLTIADDGSIKLLTEQEYTVLEETGTSITPAVAHFALWNRQAEFVEEEAPFAMPAVFLEFGKIDWRHQANGVQDADVPVMLHVLTNWVSEGYEGDLLYLDLLEQINKCLSGFSAGDWMGSIERVTSQTCHDHEDILDDIEVFKTMCYDTSACRKTLKVKRYPDISISPQIQKG